MTVAEFMSHEEARELNLVSRLTTDDYYQIGKMRTTAFHHADAANKRMDTTDYLRRLKISRARTSEGTK